MVKIERGDLLAVAAFGVMINFPWEVAHSPLYYSSHVSHWGQRLLCTGIAAFEDGLGIAALYVIGAVLFQDPQWTRTRSPIRMGATVFLGLAGAATTEWLALGLGWWSYRSEMPRVPGTALGISPLAQFVLLPLVVLFWALPHRWTRQKKTQQFDQG